MRHIVYLSVVNRYLMNNIELILFRLGYCRFAKHRIHVIVKKILRIISLFYTFISINLFVYLFQKMYRRSIENDNEYLDDFHHSMSLPVWKIKATEAVVHHTSKDIFISIILHTYQHVHSYAFFSIKII